MSTKKDLEDRIALQEKIIEQERQKNESDEMINAMASDYRSVYYVDLDTDKAICYRAYVTLNHGVKEGDIFCFSEKFTDYANKYVVESDREGFLAFIRPENIRKALGNEVIISYRYRTTAEGEERYELLRMASVNHSTDNSNDTIHAIGVGLTDVDSETRKELEKNAALSIALSQAKEANAAKTTFLTSMSHEIRTPLNAIMGYKDIALNEPGLTDGIRECLEKIGASADHLLHLINNILDMSRIESGRMLMQNQEFSFRDMLDRINRMFEGECKEKGLNYTYRLKGQVDAYYIGDELKLSQALCIILGNAVQYTPAPGDVTFIAEPLQVFDGNVSIRFIVKDTGIGIDESFLPKLFAPFTQEDETRANNNGSTGLGLAIAKNIVELMNGDIAVESKKGRGTTFRVTVTLRLAQKLDCEVIKGEKKRKKANLKGKHVLMAEDMRINAEILKRLLVSKGMIAEHAENGRIAVDMFSASEDGFYDVVLMDIRMPVLDGLAATEAIRTLNRKDARTVPIIALTANAFDEDVQLSLQAGMNAHLTKPIEAERLLETMQTLIAK